MHFSVSATTNESTMCCSSGQTSQAREREAVNVHIILAPPGRQIESPSSFLLLMTIAKSVGSDASSILFCAATNILFGTPSLGAHCKPLCQSGEC
mmetsp:Transcript_7643/g.12162  ORF Transcript_7643/g.12162 Transcript_7643/m.12162 type:complete len:95 (+) Transcript_7643:52-336(+)